MKYIITFFLAFSFLHALAQDTIELSSGDVIHGEIKNLDQNVLTIETDYSDSDFKVEWPKVTKITSEGEFLIFLDTRDKIFGSFKESENPGNVIINLEDGGSIEEPLEDIVIIDPVDEEFSDRFSASLSAGLSITKANNNRQFSIRATAGYESKNWFLSGNFNDVSTSQDEVEDIRRTDGSINFSYLFYRNWFAAIYNDFLSNTEQSIRLRNTHTLAIGNLLVRNTKLYLSASAGATYNREDYTNEAEVFNSSEGFAGFEFNIFNIGDLDFLTKLSYFPSFTDPGRNRVNFNADLKYEFPLDFFIKLGYTLNYDSKPPNNGPKDDYVFQTTIGWEY